MGADNKVYLERLKTLIEYNSRISMNYADPDALLTEILESVMHIVNCEAASLLLVKKELDGLQFAVTLGPKNSEVKNIVVGKNSVAGWVAENCQSVIINDANNDYRFNSKVQDVTKYRTRNMIAFPMVLQGICAGVIEALNKANDEDFTEDDLSILELFGKQAAIAYQNSRRYSYNKTQLEILKSAADVGKDYHPFIAKNPVIISLLENITQSSSTNSSVLITGESGVGKELFAEQVHLKSVRRGKPFVRVSCAALSPTLLESELFGHVKGAFTDAVSNRKGRFEMADGGTIFLDEIGELPLNLQSKLLRVIQERKFEKVGSSETVSVDVRIVAATNKNLEAMIKEGSFRSDLYFRLNVLPLNIPPLRERRDEIADFAQFFLEKFTGETHKYFVGFSESAKSAIYSYRWPGNIRELENTIERACIIGRPPFIDSSDLRLPLSVSAEKHVPDSAPAISYSIPEIDDSALASRSLKDAVNEFKKQYILKVLNETNWNQTTAAKILDIQRTYVSKLMTELGIRK